MNDEVTPACGLLSLVFLTNRVHSPPLAIQSGGCYLHLATRTHPYLFAARTYQLSR